MNSPDSIEMPRYQSHKKVWALKIASVELRSDGGDIYPADAGYAPFEVGLDWLTRFKPTEGDSGYYVVYEGGYTSWSPTKAFEDGYTRDAALKAHLPPGTADIPEGEEAWQNLSCDEQFALATRIAGNLGYNLTPERDEIDPPEAAKARDPELQACIDAASKAFRETFASRAPRPSVTDAGVSKALVPREPTDAMLRAAIDAIPMDKYMQIGLRTSKVTLSTEECATIYRAMIDATLPEQGQ